MSQLELFANLAAVPPLPEGLAYEPDFLSFEEEGRLLEDLEGLPYAEIRMHGVVAKRRAAHFGMDYDYQSATATPGAPLPAFLLPLRERVAAFAGRRAEEFEEVLVTEYPAGAGIGWHRDAPAFELIVGVSLAGACLMKFRPWPVAAPSDQPRAAPLSLTLEPRSAYIIRGESRTNWQHHIPPIKEPRFSITFRTIRKSRQGTAPG